MINFCCGTKLPICFVSRSCYWHPIPKPWVLILNCPHPLESITPFHWAGLLECICGNLWLLSEKEHLWDQALMLAWLTIDVPIHPEGVSLSSGLCAGRWMSSTPNPPIPAFIDLFLCSGAQLYWNRKGPSQNYCNSLEAHNCVNNCGML